MSRSLLETLWKLEVDLKNAEERSRSYDDFGEPISFMKGYEIRADLRRKVSQARRLLGIPTD